MSLRLLYLIFVRLGGWLILLGRSTCACRESRPRLWPAGLLVRPFPVMLIGHVPAVRLRHEALLFRMGVRDRPSPRRRSGRVKLEAAGAGGRRGRQEQPRQSRAGSVLPDGPGPVSETGRYTRETGVVTPLEQAPALTRWMWAGGGVHPPFMTGGELRAGSAKPGPGGHGELSAA